MNNTCPIRVTAAAGTNLAGTFTSYTLIIFLEGPEFSIDFSSPIVMLHGALLDHTYYALSKILYCSRLVQALFLARCGCTFVKIS